MSDKDNVSTTYPVSSQYPMLTPSEKMPIDHGDSAPPPIVADNQPLLLGEEDEVEVAETEGQSSDRIWIRFGRSAKNRLKSLKWKKKKEEKFEELEIAPFNPNLNTDQYGALTKLILGKADTSALKRANFSVNRLMDEGSGVDSFFDAGYSLQEMHQLMPIWSDFMGAGFNKSYLGGQWQVNLLETLYCNQQFTKANLCAALAFTMSDFMIARTTAEEYKALGIEGDGLVKLGLDFEHIFALHMPLQQFVEEFSLTKEHIFGFNLSKHQAQALALIRGWNMIALEECLGMDDEEIKTFGVGLE